MNHDNNVVFLPDVPQMLSMRKAIQQMSDNGCRFTMEEIDLIATGEQSERNTYFWVYDGYKALDIVLEEIFNGDIRD